MTLYKYWRKSIKTTCILQHLYNNNTLSTALYQCHPWLTSVPLCQFRDINSAKPTAVSRQQSSHGDGGSFGSPTWQEVMHWLDWVITGCLFAPSRSTFFFFFKYKLAACRGSEEEWCGNLCPHLFHRHQSASSVKSARVHEYVLAFETLGHISARSFGKVSKIGDKCFHLHFGCWNVSSIKV